MHLASFPIPFSCPELLGNFKRYFIFYISLRTIIVVTVCKRNRNHSTFAIHVSAAAVGFKVLAKGVPVVSS